MRFSRKRRISHQSIQWFWMKWQRYPLLLDANQSQSFTTAHVFFITVRSHAIRYPAANSQGHDSSAAAYRWPERLLVEHVGEVSVFWWLFPPHNAGKNHRIGEARRVRIIQLSFLQLALITIPMRHRYDPVLTLIHNAHTRAIVAHIKPEKHGGIGIHQTDVASEYENSSTER